MTSKTHHLSREERGGLAKFVATRIGDDLTDRIVTNKGYRIVVDGLANNAFSLIYALNELFIAEKTIPETIRIRAAAFLGNMITGRPYGIFRDFAFERMGIAKESHWARKYLADLATFAVGQSPIYAAYMVAGTAGYEAARQIAHGNVDEALEAFRHIDWAPIIKGTTMLTAASPLLGIGSGWTYDAIRNQFGLKRASQLKKS